MSSSLRYFALPTQPCQDTADNIAHLAHVHTPDGVKSVCPGLLPHSVPLVDIETACLVLIETEPGHTACCGLPLPCETHDVAASEETTR
jgi:hypothetical protein